MVFQLSGTNMNKYKFRYGDGDTGIEVTVIEKSELGAKERLEDIFAMLPFMTGVKINMPVCNLQLIEVKEMETWS